VGTFTTTAASFVADCRAFGNDLSNSSPDSTNQVSEDLASGSSLEQKGKASTRRKSKRKRSAVFNLAGSILGHSLRAPVAFFYNLANGFHNSPTILLSDRTVRSYPPITGFNSGLVRSGKEFGFGLYDGVTGLISQPYRGYKDADDRNQTPAVGILKGIGRGIGGLVFKTGAAVTGIPGYGFKGLEREIERWWLGSDIFLHGETEILYLAKDQIKNDMAKANGSRSRVQMMWDDSKGAGMGKRILERRVWQGYREVREMKTKEGGAEMEKEILERWDKLVKESGIHLE
jgi:hypothetical protein